ncbi:hypothetical protein LCGC14_1451690, partial [marine sediment metagenome]
MKILTFLKGTLMKINFNLAQLSRPQQNSLIEVLGVIEFENDREIVVNAIDFPIKLQ